MVPQEVAHMVDDFIFSHQQSPCQCTDIIQRNKLFIITTRENASKDTSKTRVKDTKLFFNDIV